MRISIKQLLGLPVATQSGAQLGAVRDVELDAESHAVRQYVVGEHFFTKQKKLISPAQVISITAEKMIVQDACGKETVTKKTESVLSQASLGGVMTREEES